jgi:hypothetical protein
VVPVVNPEGFLSFEDLALLDAALPPMSSASEKSAEGTESPL